MPKRSPKIRRLKPELAAGLRDYAPADAMLKGRLLGKIRKTFEDFGFEPLETPSIERSALLFAGEGTQEKVVFGVRPSVGKEMKDVKKDELALRFDLTVPLARFVAANPEIPKPFKRYQIGQVFRGESPQAGRFREFTQADIDIVGASSQEADAEVIGVITSLLQNLGIRNFLVKINNRKIMNALPDFAGFPKKKLFELLRLIDKKDKIGVEGAQKEIRKTFKKKIGEKIDEFLSISGDTKTKLLRVRELLKSSKEAAEGAGELIEIARTLNAMGVAQKNWEIDFSIVRGLGYYTGPVFETFLTRAPGLGSICSGGRYDNLVSIFTGEKLPAVGVSFGVDRFLTILDSLNVLKKRTTTVKVLILNLAPAFRNDYFSFANTLRRAGVNTAIYLGNDRTFQAQFAYAVKKEIPYVMIYGEEEKKKGVVTVKNLMTREQREIPQGQLAQYFKK